MASLTPDQVAYMEQHITDNAIPNILASVVVCAVLAFLAVVLRFYSRSLTRSGLGIDDWMIAFAYILYIGFFTGFGLATRWGLGRHLLLVSNGQSLTQSNISDEVFYGLAISTIKFSILLLYLRIFPQARFRYAVYLTASIIFGWLMSDMFGSIFQCTPIASQWDASLAAETKCINYGSFVLALGVINIITDFLILSLPIPVILKLNMKQNKKLLTISMFAAGSCACIVSIVRLAYAERVGSTFDASWDDVVAGILSNVEICVGIIAGCIPTYRPLLNRLMGVQDSQYQSDGGHLLQGKRHPSKTYASATSGGIVKTTDISLTTQPRGDFHEIYDRGVPAANKARGWQGRAGGPSISDTEGRERAQGQFA